MSSAITAAVPDAQREAFKAMLEATFAAYDKDGDGSLDKYVFRHVRGACAHTPCVGRSLNSMRETPSPRTWRRM